MSHQDPTRADGSDTLQTRLTADMKAAMKAGEKERLAVIRMLLNEVKNADLNQQSPEDAVAGYGKKLRKGVEEYRKYDDAERVAALEQELAVVEGYLPKMADEAETRKLVTTFLEGSSFTGPGDFGKAMGGFMRAYGTQVEPGLANTILREELNKKA